MTFRPALTIGLATALLVGCSTEKQDLEAFVKEVRSRPSPPIEPIPEIQPYIPYTYDAGKRRPPFKPMPEPREQKKPTSNNGIHPDPNRPPDPLEAFPLDSLSMVGTMTVDGVHYALIHAPDGVVYRANEGDHAGKHYGKIVAIKDKVVLLSEIVPDGTGGFMRSPASIPLAQ